MNHDLDMDVQSKPTLSGWMNDGMAVLDSRGHVLEASDSFCHWLRLTSQQVQGADLRDLLSENAPEWRQPLDDWWAAGKAFDRLVLQRSSGTSESAIAMVELDSCRHGGHCWVHVHSTLPAVTELAESGWEELAKTNDARRDLVRRLMQAETRLNSLVRNWPGVIYSQRADFSFHFVSPQIEELTGIGPDEWARQPQSFWQVIHETDVDNVRQQIHASVLSRHPLHMTYRVRHVKTGRVSYLLDQRQPVLTATGLVLGYEGVWLDVTRQTIAEKRLSSAAWKETLSHVTMGLAHDFRNLMAGIDALSEQYISEMDPEHRFHEGLTMILKNSRQASQLVQRILTLHHGKPGERNYHDLNAELREVVELVRKIVPRRISFEVAIGAEQLAVYLDPVEFRQTLINLVLNAVDAMVDCGTLAISSASCESLPELIHYCGRAPRLPAAAVVIRDSGHGIRESHLGNLFDPFFTTKSLNKGSGLGLYNARLFVEKHGGALSVDSEPGKGTHFNIWLPQADFTEGERDLEAQSRERRSLLLYGREDSTCNETAEFLRLSGYHVVTAHSDELASALVTSGEYQFSAAIIQVSNAREHREAGAWMAELRRHSLFVKALLQIVGHNEDDLDQKILKNADLVLSADLSRQAFQARLNQLFASD